MADPDHYRQMGKWTLILVALIGLTVPLVVIAGTWYVSIWRHRVTSGAHLASLGRVLLAYTNDHSGSTKPSWEDLATYAPDPDSLRWWRENIQWTRQTEGAANSVTPDFPIAYDEALLHKGRGTNVLFLDGSVRLLKPPEINRLGVTDR